MNVSPQSAALRASATPQGGARGLGRPGAAPVSPQSAALLVAESLTRTLPGELPVTLVADVSLSIARGEFVSIVGPSGSGKSSLLYLLGLLDRPSSGRLVLDGEDTSAFGEDRLADTRLAKLGFVFQFHFLLPEFSLLDNVALPMRRLARLPDAEQAPRALQLLERLGLAGHAHKQPHQISGGQRQRVAIARALANRPLLILADEPTGNLDSASSQNVRAILRELVDDGDTTVVTVTHDAQFAAGADRVVTLVDGRLARSVQVPPTRGRLRPGGACCPWDCCPGSWVARPRRKKTARAPWTRAIRACRNARSTPMATGCWTWRCAAPSGPTA